MAGGSQIIISSDGITIITPREFKVHAGQHLFKEGESQSVNFPLLPEIGSYNLQFQLKNNLGKIIPNTNYILVDEDGRVYSGKSDSNGLTQKIITSKNKKFSIHTILDNNEGVE